MSGMSHEFDIKEYIDVESALARVRGNKKLYKRMLGMLKQSEEFLKFDDGLAAGDLVKAADAAHGIKGMSGNLGVDKLFHISEQLMVSLRGGSVDEQLISEYRAILGKSLEAVDILLSTMSDD